MALMNAVFGGLLGNACAATATNSEQDASIQEVENEEASTLEPFAVTQDATLAFTMPDTNAQDKAGQANEDTGVTPTKRTQTSLALLQPNSATKSIKPSQTCPRTHGASNVP